jgi:hypothetical protein
VYDPFSFRALARTALARWGDPPELAMSQRQAVFSGGLRSCGCRAGGCGSKEPNRLFSERRLGIRRGAAMETALGEDGELYSSPNGDRWLLKRDPATGNVFVRHEANVPSGGKRTDIDIGEFLSRGQRNPEHQALLQLIGTLVEKKLRPARD